jgi:hypothetical protein
VKVNPLDGSGFCCILQYIDSPPPVIHTMASTKTTTLTFRIEPRVKGTLRAAARQEHRAISSMVEALSGTTADGMTSRSQRKAACSVRT